MDISNIRHIITKLALRFTVNIKKISAYHTLDMIALNRQSREGAKRSKLKA